MNRASISPTGEVLLTVTQLCREFDVTPRALRFYEAKGLLHPSRDGSHRRFSQRDRARLALILRGKRFGFSLAEIGQLLDLYNTDDDQTVQLTETLRTAEKHLDGMIRQRAELEEAIEELRAQMDVVQKMLADRKERDLRAAS